MAAIGGGVDHHIPGLGRDAALQDRLECAEIVVVLLEGKIVDKQNEFERIVPQFIQNRWNGVELLLAASSLAIWLPIHLKPVRTLRISTP